MKFKNLKNENVNLKIQNFNLKNVLKIM